LTAPKTVRDHLTRVTAQVGFKSAVPAYPVPQNTRQPSKERERSSIFDFRIDAFIDENAKALADAIKFISNGSASGINQLSDLEPDLLRVTLRETLLLRQRVSELEQAASEGQLTGAAHSTRIWSERVSAQQGAGVTKTRKEP
jgi:hypothetical protein